MMLITAFIGVSIMLAIAVSILSGVQGGFDCKSMQGYDTSKSTDDNHATTGKFVPNTWSGTCYEIQEQTQQSLNLIVVILIVIAAVAILVVVRML